MSRRFDRREFLLTATGAVVCSIGVRAQGAARGAAAVDAIDKAMPELMSRFGVPGAALAVFENRRVAALRAYGVRKAGAPERVVPTTVFEAASLGKPLFAYLVVKLAEEGVIELDESIAPFFRQPDFVNEPAIEAITPRIVLSHRTGLGNWRSPREPEKLRFAPGSAFSYSGEAYVRLQRAVEKATGRSVNDLITDRLLNPWKMAQSSYVWRADYASLAAEGHDAVQKPTRTRLWEYSPSSARKLPPGVEPPPIFEVPNAAASLYSTAADYATFVAQLLAPPRPDAAHLSAASLEAMLRPTAKVNDEISWGLGWGLARVAGVRHFWHWGNNDVYQSFVTASAEDGRGIVVFTNSANGLRMIREVVTPLLGEEHPAFRWTAVLRQP